MIHKPLYLAVFVPLVFLTVALGVAGIQSDSIWYDEYLSLHYAGWPNGLFDLVHILDRIVSSSGHRVLTYDVLLAGWSAIVGWSVFAARYLSLLLGVLAVAWMYRIGEDWYSRSAGIYSAIFLGGSAFLGIYLHEIRTYSLLIVETLVVLWLYQRLLHGRQSWLAHGSFAIIVTASLYSHSFMTPMVVALGLYHLIFVPRRNTGHSVTALFLVSAVAFSPWALLTIRPVVEFLRDTGTPFVRSNLELLGTLAYALSNGFLPFLLLPILSLKRMRSAKGVSLLWFVGLSFLSVMLIINQSTARINQVRYLIPLLPVFALLCGIALAHMAERRTAIAVILAVWCIAGLNVESHFRSALYLPEEYEVFHLSFPFKEVTAVIRSELTVNDAVVYEFPHHSWALQGVIDFYMHGTSSRYVLTEKLGTGDDPGENIAEFENFIGNAGRVYFVLDRTIAAGELLGQYERILEDRYVRCKRLSDTTQVLVDKYARVEALCKSPSQPRVQYQAPVALLDFVHEQSGDLHILYSVWSADVPADTYSYSIRIWDSSGNLRKQVDNSLPLGSFNYAIDHVSAALLPSVADFRVEVVVYDWRTGDRLNTEDGSDVVEVDLFE